MNTQVGPFGRMLRVIVTPFARLLPPCDKIVRWESEAIDSPLSLWRRWVMKLHKVTCIFCSRYDQQIHLLRNLLQKAGTPEQTDAPFLPPDARLSMEAKERMQALLSRSDVN